MQILSRKLFIVLPVLLFAFSFCDKNQLTDSKTEVLVRDLTEIRHSGKLIAVTDFNSTNYFIYKGEPMGFTYELLESFADHLGLELEIVSENSLDRAFEMLNSGNVDLMAIGLTINSATRKELSFTDPIFETRQVLVQRKPHNWKSLTLDQIDRTLIRKQLDLAGKSVYVQSGSPYAQRLKNLGSEMGDSINIVEVPYEPEELISLVDGGEIDYTVCDENVALVNSSYYPDLDVATPVSFAQNLAWGVRKQYSDDLLKEINIWIKSFRASGSYALLYAKYFKNSKSSTIIKSDYYALNTGKVSKYDDLIKQYSDTLGWDWLLLASVVCQESRFDPNASSESGAYGLMQIMPLTGELLGIDINGSPENNIRAGVTYIKWLDELFKDKIPDKDERIKFILASYNAGYGHVIDARELARKNGKNPEIWNDNVDIYLIKKSDPAYYNDPVVKNGFCRGDKPVRYVTEILERYEHYKNIVPQFQASLSLVQPANNVISLR
jgi:membrane-bound lytic murein transglycosylase F